MASLQEPELSPELALVVATQNMNAQLTPIKQRLEMLQTEVHNMKLTMKKMQQVLETIHEDIEANEKNDLYKSVVIYGLQETPGENYNDLTRRIQELGNALGMTSLDFDRAWRMGKRQQNRSRPVCVILLRHQDKLALFAALAKSKEDGNMKDVFINQARTKEDHHKHMKLLQFAKARKLKDITTAFRIRNLTLQITSKELNGYFQVNKQGEIAGAALQKKKVGLGTFIGKKTGKSGPANVKGQQCPT